MASDPAVIRLALNENMSLREVILQLRKEIEMLTMKHWFGIHHFAGPDRHSDFFFWKVRCAAGPDSRYMHENALR